ncbi:transposase [Desulfovibrio sulfodismutans]|uniref:Transposase n=1 Tax=Desulfolutivibrio sulfodismutans TaxID=63561 RepID=A0A7K3NP24_9BACT|nr:transposase [Desulfolutivibrio sulfodismutans]NDY57948.1 transposase [Desulfolutivibrio sulfodismutans]QLA14618.1 transposase [Desulfolutivibrio sulfodismutans DSM 3696]
MRKIRFSEALIIGILKQPEAGMTGAALCRGHEMPDATFYKWRGRYGGLDVVEAIRLRGPEEESQRLKRLVAELAPDNQMLTNVPGKTAGARRTPPGRGSRHRGHDFSSGGPAS